MSDELIWIKNLRQSGVTFAQGLSHNQVRQIEEQNNFQFPDDLKAFLQQGVPISWTYHVTWSDESVTTNGFPDWHGDSVAVMEKAREYILHVTTFDLEYNNFWMDEWGPRPLQLAEAQAIAIEALASVPVMIPIFGHRFIPAEPTVPGNPVFSIAQMTDTIIYGYDLSSYLHNEFSRQEKHRDRSKIRTIRFWSKIVS